MIHRREFYDKRAQCRLRESKRGYHQLLQRYFTFLIPPNARVLEIGCGIGDLLAAVKPSYGVGIDFAEGMVALARQRHPELKFHMADAMMISGEEQFDYIILSDLINDLPDVQQAFATALRHAHPNTRIVVNFFNSLWRPVLSLTEKCGLKAPTLQQNWLSMEDVKNLLHLAGWEVVKSETRILWPAKTLLLDELLNRWLAPCLKHFCLTIFIVARPRPIPDQRIEHESGKAGQVLEYSETGHRLRNRQYVDAIFKDDSLAARPKKEFRCSVVIPARNEAGNIEAAVQRTPELGLGTEIIFIEGHSKDNTWEEIQRVKAKYPHRDIKALKQTSKGKGGAVREAFACATGDLLLILDADLTMPPEELPKFYEIARSGLGDFVNGVRLVYPMENQAMQFLNMIANKLFGIAFTWLLGQPIRDTLCGTKVLFRRDYELISKNRAYFGDFDPFGDFDLLFGAAKLNLKIIDLPIRYRARTYGSTNISRWSHGWLLLRMVLFAAKRFKFLA
ncbi:MAG: arnC 3 [Verrucomicrobiales bacterium]|nr:arnC 3 [Verrucomicrobiales bacterium]